MLFFDPDRNPVDEALFGQICRATSDQARDLALGLPELQRAHLAMFCNARAHLREHGRAIAGACDPAHLARIGAVAGQVLAAQVTAGPQSFGMPPKWTRQVSLAGR